MKKIYILLSAVFIFIFYAATSAQPVTITLQPDGLCGKDAIIANCIPCGYDNTNYGNSAEWNAIAWTNGAAISYARSLIQFDLTSIPAGSLVQSAYLSVYFDPVSSNIGHAQLSGANDAYLLKITSPWDETTVTWNSQPGTTITNQVYFPPSVSSSQNYVNMNVAAMIQDFVNIPGQNYGMMLKLATEQHYRSLIFSSSDHPDATLHPKLEVTYIPSTANCVRLQYANCNGIDAMVANCVPCGYDNANFGSATEFSAIAWTNQANVSNARSILHWNLSFIPANATVTSAYLSLYAFNSPSNGQHSTLSGPNDAYLQKVTSPWNEYIVNWNNKPPVTTANQVYLPPSSSPTQDYTNINITTLVQDMVTNPATNYGLMLQLVNESYYRKLIFASSDNPDPAKHPRLDIYYTVPATITPAGSTTFCSGGSVVLNANTGFGLSYQWKKNGINISGATASSYTATTTGSYTVTEANSCGSVTSAPIIVTVNTVPAVPGAITGPSTFCSNQQGVTYSIAAVAGATTYNWLVPQGATVASGQGTTSITVNFGNKNGNVKVAAGNACGNSAYKTKKVTKNCREGMISDFTEINVKVYPNPSSADFVFEIENTNEEKISINIYDMIGKLILSENNINPQFTIRNSQLSPGIYSAVVIVGENKKTLKIVKTE